MGGADTVVSGARIGIEAHWNPNIEEWEVALKRSVEFGGTDQKIVFA